MSPRLVAVAAVACAAFACTTVAPTVVTTTPSLPRQALAVPLVSQANSWSCGAAALAAVLYYWQVFDGHETELYASLGTTEKDGTPPAAIAAEARRRGLDARLRTGLTVDDLRAALGRGDTAILDVQAWGDARRPPWPDDWEDGHYVVLVAIDGARAYVMDPSAHLGYAWLPLDELALRWHDYEAPRPGARVEYVHAAVLVHGRTPLATAPLVRMN